MEQEMQAEQKAMKKAIKKDANRVGWGLIFYSLITLAVIVLEVIVRVIWILIQTTDEAKQDATSTIIGVILGILYLKLFFAKKVSVKNIFAEKRKIAPGVFWQILCVFLGMQLVFMMVDGVLEAGLNLIGYSALQSIEEASLDSTTISMFLYAGFVAPIVEEIIYRGFVLSILQKHGKMLAIVISSLLFGVMHANLPQGLYAFGVGIILAYVAVEYSIIWSILLHIINNCLLADLLGKATAGFGEQTQEIIEYAVIFVFFALGAVFVWRNRAPIKEYLIRNRESKKKYWYALTSIAMIIFIVMETAVAIFQLTPL